MPFTNQTLHMKKLLLFFVLISFCAFSHIHSQGDTTTTAKSFNIAAETQKYLDTLSPAQKAKSDAYFEGGYWLILWNLLYTIGVGFIFLRLGLSRWIKNITNEDTTTAELADRPTPSVPLDEL